jgi:hypothetical protein
MQTHCLAVSNNLRFEVQHSTHVCLQPTSRSIYCLPADLAAVQHMWRQLLRLHLDHADPAVTQQAAAALVIV